MARGLLHGHLGRLSLHELLSQLQVELFQQNRQPGLRVLAL